jgi:hypothetical protein
VFNQNNCSYDHIDKGAEKIFWTDITRHGCANQYSACFSNSTKSSRIHATQFDGNCVAIYAEKKSKHLLYKTMQCKKQLPIVCVGSVPVENSLKDAVSTQKVEINNKIAQSDLEQSKSCSPNARYFNYLKKCIYNFAIYSFRKLLMLQKGTIS